MRPIHYAARSGDMPSVCHLLSNGADPAAATGEGHAASALARMHPAVSRVLQQAMQSASVTTGARFPSSELVAAASKGKVPRVATLLGQKADPDSTDGTLSALQKACAERHPQATMQRAVQWRCAVWRLATAITRGPKHTFSHLTTRSTLSVCLLRPTPFRFLRNPPQRTATHRNATQRNATQRNATHRNAPHRNATHRNAPQRTTAGGPASSRRWCFFGRRHHCKGI